jgi:hypothetical protein
MRTAQTAASSNLTLRGHVTYCLGRGCISPYEYRNWSLSTGYYCCRKQLGDEEIDPNVRGL